MDGMIYWQRTLFIRVDTIPIRMIIGELLILSARVDEILRA